MFSRQKKSSVLTTTFIFHPSLFFLLLPIFYDLIEMGEKEDEPLGKWSYFVGSVAISAIGHPVEYAKVLIQLGHEPLAPRATKTLLGKPVLALPNVFRYVGYIKSVDGFAGCFRGLSAKITANITSSFTVQVVRESIENRRDKYGLVIDDLDEETRKKREFIDKLSTELIAHTAGVIVSHPFQVICVRMMAQFVGGEDKYSSIWGSIAEIWQKEGLLGFFSGLMPRLVGDLLNVTLTAVFGVIICRTLPDSEEMKNYSNAVSGFVASAITYPFNLVSNCMIVSSSGLVAGSPPRMPEYRSWLQCWGHLYRTNQLKRGSALLWRYYKGPYVLINEQPVMLNKDEFATSAKLRD